MSFSHLRDKSGYFLSHPEYCKTKDGLIDLACRDCEFWKEDDRDYQCGALALLNVLLQKNVLKVEDIINAISE